MTPFAHLLALFLLVVFVGLMLFFSTRVRNGHRPHLRPIEAFDAIRKLTSQSIETGRPLHLSLGVGGLGDESTADTLAGLSVLTHMSQRAAITGVQPVVSMASPMALLFAQNIARQTHQTNLPGLQEAFYNTRWLAPQPAAYAAGVMSLYSLERVNASVMVGEFGDEYLLLGEPAAQRDITHIGGASNPNTLPFIYASAQETLLGEEIYAAGAYLQKQPAHIGSLLAQDAVRWIVAALILGGVVLATVG